MRRLAPLALVAALTASLALAGCSSGAVIAPIVRDVGDLQGETIDLRVGQVLDINTGDLAVDSYSGEVATPSIAEFTPGREDGSAVFNPGITGKEPGTTKVVLSNSDGGIQDVTFEVHVDQ